MTNNRKVSLKDVQEFYQNLGSIMSAIHLAVGAVANVAPIWFYLKVPAQKTTSFMAGFVGFIVGSAVGGQKSRVPNLVILGFIASLFYAVHLFLVDITSPLAIRVIPSLERPREFMLAFPSLYYFLTAVPFGVAVGCLGAIIVFLNRLYRDHRDG